MPIFHAKARTAETFLAGIGASGALMGSAFVLFVILVGAVTFDAWPHGNPFGGGGNVALSARTASAPVPPPGTLNLVKLLGGGPVATTARGGRPHLAAPIATGGLPSPNGQAPGGANGTPPAPGGGQGPVSTPQPPSPPSQPANLLSQTVSGAGNTVQGSTQSLGNTVNSATGTTLGNVVSGAGGTLNSDLQSLACTLGCK
jgi:hypothetical protein